MARAQRALAELYVRPEQVVVIVSHSAFLSKAVSGCMFGNADYRVFSFEEPLSPEAAAAEAASLVPPSAEGDPEGSTLPPIVYRLREWDETRQTHGGMGWSYDERRTIGQLLPA